MNARSARRPHSRSAASDQPVGNSGMMETLESRLLMTNFVYHELGSMLDPYSAVYVLHPGWDDGSARTTGSAVDAAGDVNGDGFGDILVGAGGNTSRQNVRGIAALYSGHTGQLLFSFNDGFTEFGCAVAGIGDVNGDGTPDVLIGSPRFETNNQAHEIGRAYIYSGRNGQLLRTFTGAATGDRFGSAVASAGDFNHDGVTDVIIGAPGADGGGTDRGRAYIFSGANGNTLATFTGIADRDALGYSVGSAGDLNGDSFTDLIVGAPGRLQGQPTTPGHAYIFSGQNQALLRTFTGDENGDWLGFSVHGAGDVNADGTPDVIVGAPHAWNRTNGNVPQAGLARVFSGANGSILLTIRGDAPNINLGAAVSGAGDVNRDGRADLLIGAPGASNAGHAGVYSGANGAVLAKYSRSTSDLLGGDRLGSAVAAVGDINGDGFIDFVFGASQDANAERNDRGRMYVFSGIAAAALLPNGLNSHHDIWGTSGSQDFIILDGDVFLLPSRAGFMSGDHAIDVNAFNAVLGASDAQGHDPFLWSGGTRTTVASMITSEQGGPAGTYTNLRAVDLTDGGLILVERTRNGTTATTWLLDHGVLRYLFDGIPMAMSESQLVIGVAPGTEFRSFIWTPAAGVTQITGFRAAKVNALGGLAGTAPGPNGVAQPAVRLNGVIMPLGIVAGGTNFVVRGISNSNEVVGTYTRSNGTTSSFDDSPGQPIQDIRPLITENAPPAINTSTDLRIVGINNHGMAIGGMFDLGRGFMIEWVNGPGVFRSVVGEPVGISTSADGTTNIVTINEMGAVVLFRKGPSDDGWTHIDLTDATGAAPANFVTSFTDASTGRVGYAASSDAGLLLIQQSANGAWTVRNLTTENAGAAVIVGAPVTLTLPSGLVLISGLTTSGDIVIYGKTSRTDSQGRTVWEFNNLYQTQLRNHGITPPTLVGKLVPYVTSWNGMNIAALDTSGHVHTLWTAPDITGWRETDLTPIAGTPTIVGGLVAYVTPWGGLNIAGNDASGDVVVTWWVPQFGPNWRQNNLTDQFHGPALRAESITSYVTPWGGLNIAGRTDDGRTVVYWWAPGRGPWDIGDIGHPTSDARMIPVGALSSHAAPDGSLHVVGVGRFGDVLHLRWQPGGDWTMEDLS